MVSNKTSIRQPTGKWHGGRFKKIFSSNRPGKALAVDNPEDKK
jgi:hypothetical protein